MSLKYKKKALKLLLLIVVLGVIVFGVVWYRMMVDMHSSPPKRDYAVRYSDIKQIKLSLELYYNKYDQYPAGLQELVREGFIKEKDVLKDPKRGNTYSYVFGVDKKNGLAKYFHLGALFTSQQLQRLPTDQDYNSTKDTDQIDWEPGYDSSFCIEEEGLDGSDSNSCSFNQKMGVYDIGDLPSEGR